MKNASVERLTFDGSRATGVTYRQNGHLVTITAGREVIVSAGSVNSPKLLQLSGLGPEDVLRSCGIELRRHLPEVGGGLQDHLAATYHYRSRVPTFNNQLGPLHGPVLAALRYLLTRRGILSLGINQCGRFIRSSAEAPRPDMQIYRNPATYSTGDGSKPRLDSAPGFILSFQPCRPASRGRIDIASSDPYVAPHIKLNSFTEEADCEAVRRGGRLLRQLIETPTMARLIESARQPDPASMDDKAVLEHFRETACTVYYPTSTYRMGADKAGGVLDP